MQGTREKPGQPGIILGFSLNWPRMAQSFLFFPFHKRERECLAVYLGLVEAKVLRAGDGGLGRWGQILPRLAPRLYL